MIYLILFLIGASLGSFLNVLALRYKEDKFLLNQEIIGGRSHCLYCNKKLNWYELIPLISFIIQKGKCRDCKKKLSWQYPLVEFISGLIFIATLIYFQNKLLVFFNQTLFNQFYFWTFIFIWNLIFLTLILVFLIDLRLKIIPNEVIIFLFILALFLNVLIFRNWNNFYSFLGPYNSFFGNFYEIFWQNRLIAFIFSLLFFGGLVLITLGRGIGMGDVKLMLALALIFGWPDILIISGLSFILGGIVSVFLILYKKTTIKGILPFGPFIVSASFLIFLWGEEILNFYFLIINKIIN